MFLTVYPLSVSQVQFPAAAEYFKKFSLADHTLPTRPEPAWQKMAQSPVSGTTHNSGTWKSKANSNHEQTMIEIKNL